MSEKQISALQGFLLAVLAALVASGVLDAGMGDTLRGLVGGAIGLIAAFLVKRPRDH